MTSATAAPMATMAAMRLTGIPEPGSILALAGLINVGLMVPLRLVRFGCLGAGPDLESGSVPLIQFVVVTLRKVTLHHDACSVPPLSTALSLSRRITS